MQEWLSTDELQKMATQVHLPETAFLFPSPNGAWSIRWFSPLVEIDLCGHATLAAAHVLYQEGFASDKDAITFSSSAGILKVQKRGKQSVALEMPVLSYRKSSISPLLVEGLGSYPDHVYVGMVFWSSSGYRRGSSYGILSLYAGSLLGQQTKKE